MNKTKIYLHSGPRSIN